MRPMAILTVTDRVLQRAVLRVADDVFDRAFHDCSFGYRAGRGLRQAVPKIIEHRQRGRQWVFDADIDDCFGSLDHELIVEFFRKRVDDPVVLRLLKQWLKKGRLHPLKAVGVPQGGVISPLLCNVYLHPLDVRLALGGFSPIRYADDFCAFCDSEEQAQQARQETETILVELKLRLEPAKTKITHFDEGFDFLGVHFYRDTYSFLCAEKRIEVKGEFDPALFYDYVPEGYH